jgi:hypothetical protein
MRAVTNKSATGAKMSDWPPFFSFPPLAFRVLRPFARHGRILFTDCFFEVAVAAPAAASTFQVNRKLPVPELTTQRPIENVPRTKTSISFPHLYSY